MRSFAADPAGSVFEQGKRFSILYGGRGSGVIEPVCPKVAKSHTSPICPVWALKYAMTSYPKPCRLNCQTQRLDVVRRLASRMSVIVADGERLQAAVQVHQRWITTQEDP